LLTVCTAVESQNVSDAAGEDDRQEAEDVADQHCADEMRGDSVTSAGELVFIMPLTHERQISRNCHTSDVLLLSYDVLYVAYVIIRVAFEAETGGNFCFEMVLDWTVLVSRTFV